MPEGRSNAAPAVTRAVQILDYLANFGPDIGVSAIAAGLGLSKSTCYNILQALASESLVIKDSRFPVYRLGPRLVELGMTSRLQNSHRDKIMKIMLQLITPLSVTCLVAQPLVGDRGMIIVDRISPAHSDALIVPVGTVFPITSPALGAAFLAWRDIDEVTANVRQFGDVSQNELQRLASSLDIVRQRGYSWATSEYQPGTAAIAAPVFGPDLEISLILCLIGPAERLPLEDLEAVGNQLLTAAREIAGLLARGGSPGS